MDGGTGFLWSSPPRGLPPFSHPIKIRYFFPFSLHKKWERDQLSRWVFLFSPLRSEKVHSPLGFWNLTFGLGNSFPRSPKVRARQN